MLEKITRISNPLTVIAIFAAITEVMGIGVLPFVSDENQLFFIKFLIGFPSILIVLFFITLNFNHRVLYAPSDYRTDDGFLAASKIQNSNLTTQDEKLRTKGIMFGSVSKKEEKE